MSVYPSGNPGVYPVDMSTDTGKFRVKIGDIVGTLYSPDYTGYANFVKISDAEIGVFLDSVSLNRGLYGYYLTLAANAAENSKSVKDSDLAVDLTKRSGALLAIAEGYLEKAKAEEALTDEYDVFELLPGLSSDVHPSWINRLYPLYEDGLYALPPEAF